MLVYRVVTLTSASAAREFMERVTTAQKYESTVDRKALLDDHEPVVMAHVDLRDAFQQVSALVPAPYFVTDFNFKLSVRIGSGSGRSRRRCNGGRSSICS